MKILRVNTRNGEYSYTAVPERLEIIGGRGFIAHILNEEVRPGSYALGEENTCIICNGPLAGLGLSSAGRLSIGGKSPLTGGIKESNSGGTAADALAKLGLRAIILENKPDSTSNEEKWYFIKVDQDGIEFIPADEYIGYGNGMVQQKLTEHYGTSYCYITIGQAGEKLYHNSSLAITDVHGRPGRVAARGGLGAVLGSKRIKGIFISRKGTYQPSTWKSGAFKKARKAYHSLITKNERVKVLREYGTASTVMDVQRLGAMPTCNFSKGTFEGVEKLSGESIHDLIAERGGEGRNFESCMDVCIIQCSNVYAGKDGKEIVAPLEYETISLLGPNLGLSNPDDVARINTLCNDYGLDTIETGGALGVMAEAGILEFGNAEKFIEAVHEVPTNGWLGRLIGMGTGVTGKVLNVRRTPVVKNQCMSGYDPRGVKGTGVTYATSPMGADHTAGLTVFLPIDHNSKEGQIEASKKMQIGRSAYDTLGLCAFLMAATAPHPDIVVALINAIYETELEPSFIQKIGLNTIKQEKLFNRKAGLTNHDDRIPSYFKEEILSPNNLMWDIEDKDLDMIFEENE